MLLVVAFVGQLVVATSGDGGVGHYVLAAAWGCSPSGRWWCGVRPATVAPRATARGCPVRGERRPLLVLLVVGFALGVVGNVLVLAGGDGGVWNVVLAMGSAVGVAASVWQWRRESDEHGS